MEKFENMKIGATFTAVNKTTSKSILCKKSSKNMVYVYTFHDCDGRKMGGYREDIKTFSENHII